MKYNLIYVKKANECLLERQEKSIILQIVFLYWESFHELPKGNGKIGK
jgi:hypothetical protein